MGQPVVLPVERAAGQQGCCCVRHAFVIRRRPEALHPDAAVRLALLLQLRFGESWRQPFVTSAA